MDTRGPHPASSCFEAVSGATTRNPHPSASSVHRRSTGPGGPLCPRWCGIPFTSDPAAEHNPTSETTCSRPLAGKAGTVLSDRQQPHTYTYIPDIGEGLTVLAEHWDAPGEILHLPNARSTQELADTRYRQLGQNRTRIRGVPPLLLGTTAITSPIVRQKTPTAVRRIGCP